MLPSCPFSSTCVTPGVSYHTQPEGEPCIYMDKNSVKPLVCTLIEGYTEGSQYRTHGKYCSTCVYVHKCVAEECRTTRTNRTRCTQYARQVARTCTSINVSEKSAESQDRIEPAALNIEGRRIEVVAPNISGSSGSK